jgi:hypothetical protein
VDKIDQDICKILNYHTILNPKKEATMNMFGHDQIKNKLNKFKNYNGGVK